MPQSFQKQFYRKNIRLKDYDYSSNGCYFVTLCSSLQHKFIKKYENILKEELCNITKKYLMVSVDEVIFMDDHCHIIFEFQDCKEKLSTIIQYYKSKTTARIKDNGYTEKRSWQPNYYEHIIRNEKELEKIKLYIKANPYDEKIDWTRIEEYTVML